MIKLSSLCPISSQWNSTIIPLISRSRSCTSHILWICNETYEGPGTRAKAPIPRHFETAYCYRATNALKTLDPGAAAHMSLHLNNNVKERKIPTLWIPPFRRKPQAPGYLLTTPETLKASAAVKPLYPHPAFSVNGFFHKTDFFLSRKGTDPPERGCPCHNRRPARERSPRRIVG